MASARDIDLDEVYQFAVQLGKDAGSLLQKAAESRLSSDSVQAAHVEKENAVDIVTQTDEGEHDWMRIQSTILLHAGFYHRFANLAFQKMSKLSSGTASKNDIPAISTCSQPNSLQPSLILCIASSAKNPIPKAHQRTT